MEMHHFQEAVNRFNRDVEQKNNELHYIRERSEGPQPHQVDDKTIPELYKELANNESHIEHQKDLVEQSQTKIEDLTAQVKQLQKDKDDIAPEKALETQLNDKDKICNNTMQFVKVLKSQLHSQQEPQSPQILESIENQTSQIIELLFSKFTDRTLEIGESSAAAHSQWRTFQARQYQRATADS